MTKDNQAQANEDHNRQMLDMLGTIQDDPNSGRLVDLVEAIAQTGKGEAAQYTRQNDISAVKGKIEMYKEKGDTEKLKDARARLLDLCEKPVVVGIPAAPVPVGGNGGNSGQELEGGNSGQERDSGGNSGQELDGGGNSGQGLDGGGNGGQESGGGGGDGEEFVGVGGGDGGEFFGIGGENNSDSEEVVVVVVA